VLCGLIALVGKRIQLGFLHQIVCSDGYDSGHYPKRISFDVWLCLSDFEIVLHRWSTQANALYVFGDGSPESF